MNRILLGLLTLTLLAAGCAKGDNTTVSYEDMLRGGQWRRTALTVTYRLPTGVLKTDDAYKDLDSCLMDNTLEFQVNYVGTEHNNARKCNPGTPDQTGFNWEVYNSGRNLRLYNITEIFGGDNSINAEVLTLTSNQLSIRYTAIERDPITQDADTVTFADTFRK